jgi:hypothetical protein
LVLAPVPRWEQEPARLSERAWVQGSALVLALALVLVSVRAPGRESAQASVQVSALGWVREPARLSEPAWAQG